MSQYMPEIVRCSVCGKKSEQQILISTNSFGAPDLDLRPPEMERSTMDTWIQQCPYCGYVSESLDDVPKINMPFLKTDEYRKCLGLVFKSKLAEMFYQQYLIQVVEKNTQKAFYAVLHSAWACDDVGDEENAILCRKYALAELDKLTETSKNETLWIQRSDLLRRAGLFQRVIDEYEPRNFSDDLLNQISRFQVLRAYEEDSSCYTVDYIKEAEPPMVGLIDKVASSFREIGNLFRKNEDDWEE